MPTVKTGESKKRFLKRCIPEVIKDEGETPLRAVAKCSGIFDTAKRTNNQKRPSGLNPLKLDPTRTTMLRRQFMSRMNKRFAELSKKLRELIVIEDAFGLKPKSRNPFVGNVRWAFLTDAQKVTQFDQWLKAQINTGVLDITGEGAGAEPWTDTFIQEAYKKGIGAAFDGVNPFGVGSKEDFLRVSFGGPIATEKVRLIGGRTFSALKGISDQTSNQISQELVDGLVRGDSPREIARLIKKRTEIGRKRSLTLARTEVIRAHAEGNLDALEQLGVEEVGVAVEWSTTGDFKVCPMCRPLDGVILKINEARGMLPRHPNCVLPGNLVQGRVKAALKSWYSGEVVEITTSNGSTFSLTVNHPILTKERLVLAGQLNKGDNLLSYSPESRSGVSIKEDYAPTFIEDIFESLHPVVFKKPSSSFNFYGDEKFMMGEVEVVCSNLSMREGLSHSLKDINQIFFKSTNDSSMSRSNLSLSLCERHSRPLNSLSFGPSSRLNPILNQPTLYESSADFESNRKIVDTLSLVKQRCHETLIDTHSMPNFYSFGSGSQLDTLLDQPSRNSIPLYSKFCTQLLQRHSRVILLDKVLHVRRFHYSGPVYDVETDTGYFTCSQTELASTLIVNCRCAWIPANVNESQEGQKRSQTEIKKAVSDSVAGEISPGSKRTLAEQKRRTFWSGVDKKLSKKRPESIF